MDLKELEKKMKGTKNGKDKRKTKNNNIKTMAYSINSTRWRSILN